MAKLDYYNITHKGISYSRSLTLHACPRKYELDAKKAIKARRESVTFSYGHAVGAGVQSTLEGKSLNRTIIDTILAYTNDEDDLGTENEQQQKKSIWWAVTAAQEFHSKYNAGVYSFLDGWEIAVFTKDGEEIKAVELTFVIDLVDGFSYEGHIDLVLYHPVKNRYMVLELKTTGMSAISEASYKNSAQALGYGIVVDLIAANLNASASFDVLYLIYKSRSRELIPMQFRKTALLRSRWMSSLLCDVQSIRMYEENGYPMYGESCYDFFRECEYLQVCAMSDEAIDRMYSSVTEEVDDDQTYSKMMEPTFFFTVEELLARQDALVSYATSDNASDEVDMLLDVVQIER